MFNTREIAYMIYAGLLFCYVLYGKGRHKAFFEMAKLLFCRKFLYVYGIALTYSALCLMLLSRIGVWDSSLSKDTVMWFIFVACPLMFQSAKVKSFEDFKKEIFLPLVSVSIVFEYVVGLYTFPLWVELIMAPLFVVIGGMLGFIGNKVEHLRVKKFLNGLSAMVGFVALIFIVIHLINHYRDYLNRATLMQFLMPFLLSLMFVPLLYSLSMFVHYEDALVILKRQLKNRGVFYYALGKAMFRFHGDLSGLGRWRKMVVAKNLKTIEEIDQSMDLIKELQEREEELHTVNIGLGWPPYQLKELLTDKGILMPEYSNHFKEEFMSISFPVKIIDDGPLADTISYMILGTKLVATQLQLELKVYHGRQDHLASLMRFLACAKQLYMGVFGEEMQDEFVFAILEVRDRIAAVPLATVSVKKLMWDNQTDGFSLDFIVTHHNHSE